VEEPIFVEMKALVLSAVQVPPIHVIKAALAKKLTILFAL
jgi:hypothetical protein